MSSLRKKLLDGLAKSLVGTEKLAPEIATKVRSFVTETGRALPSAASSSRRFGGNLLLGNKDALNVIKARYAQGGLVGPGGVLLGELAFDPKFKDLVKRIRTSKGPLLDPYTGKMLSRRRATAKALGKGVTESLNPAFLVGLPLLDLKGALDAPEYTEEGGYSGTLGTLGSAAGFMATGPLGLLGGLGGSLAAGGLGKYIGSKLDPEDKPIYSGVSEEGYRTPSISNFILDAATQPQYT